MSLLPRTSTSELFRVNYSTGVCPLGTMSDNGGPLTEPALVNEHYRARLPLGFFLSSGQRRFCQRSMAGSSRSRAFPVGRWQLHPSFFNTQLTCPAWYFTPKSRSISSATRSRVQRLVSYPNASVPCLSPVSRLF